MSDLLSNERQTAYYNAINRLAVERLRAGVKLIVLTHDGGDLCLGPVRNAQGGKPSLEGRALAEVLINQARYLAGTEFEDVVKRVRENGAGWK